MEVLTHDTAREGRFGFTSHIAGEHLICLQTTTSNYYGTQREFRFSLVLDAGEAAQDYGELAKQEHLTAIEVEVRKLNDKIKQIRGEQDYQTQREKEFRDTSEATNSAVLWWSIIQTVLLLAAGVWQLTMLKKFFKSKKLA